MRENHGGPFARRAVRVADEMPPSTAGADLANGQRMRVPRWVGTTPEADFTLFLSIDRQALRSDPGQAMSGVRKSPRTPAWSLVVSESGRDGSRRQQVWLAHRDRRT
jgi:hypothetical protein